MLKLITVELRISYTLQNTILYTLTEHQNHCDRLKLYYYYVLIIRKIM